ncbi:MAG: UDP binding domain-containing protein, partial [bacterium]
LKSVIEVNEAQRYRFVDRIRRSYVEYRGLTLAILGLSFKPQTDDLRESPALDIMRELHRDGMVLRATDPAAMVGATAQFPYATYLADPVACITDSDGVVLCTEWPQFQALDWGALALKVRRPIIFDGRNCLDPSAMRAAGWTYYGVGRP